MGANKTKVARGRLGWERRRACVAAPTRSPIKAKGNDEKCGSKERRVKKEPYRRRRADRRQVRKPVLRVAPRLLFPLRHSSRMLQIRSTASCPRLRENRRS